jgi:hypothetical protein
MGVATAAAQSPPSPSEMLATAIRTLESRETISAKVSHEVNLFGQHLVGSGVYYEQRPGRDNLLRLELRLQLGDRPSSLVTVCDGRYLWEHRNLPSRAELSRIDVIRALRALERAEEPLAVDRSMAMPGLGGLPRLLRGLESHFDFTTADRGKWEGQNTVFWRLEGTWKPTHLARLMPNQAEAIGRGQCDLSHLPKYLPDSVAVFLGEADQFPYRIEYRRASADEGQPARPLVSMKFYDVGINERIDRALFIYNPPSDTEFSDETENFIKLLRGEEREGLATDAGPQK